MTNHVYLLMTPSNEKRISMLMILTIDQELLWEGRYKSTLVDSDKYF